MRAPGLVASFHHALGEPNATFTETLRATSMSGPSRAEKFCSTLKWLPGYLWQLLARRSTQSGPVQLIFALADHFEPSVTPGAYDEFAERGEQVRRLERWCREYPKAVSSWRDSDGRPLRHTYFYPAEQHDEGLIAQLAEHCLAGWGEIEIQLHHGVRAPDTAENTRRVLLQFRDALARQGCLSRWEGKGIPRYAFVHGNWALANSKRGRFCGVDQEMQILAETGCYADLTLPSAPDSSQVGKINSIYECTSRLSAQAPHRRGRDLARGHPPRSFPVIVQGPLWLNFGRHARGLPPPSIENGELSAGNPPTMERLRLWRRPAISVRGQPAWQFIKLHCHGMDPRDEAVMLGPQLQQFLQQLVQGASSQGKYRLHFVTAREMVNIILAACDGHTGDPGDHRDYRLWPITPASQR